MATTYDPGREQYQVTAQPGLQSEKARFDPNGSMNSLLSALGTQGTQQGLADFQHVYDTKKLQDQTLKLDSYTQQFMQDHAGGSVSQAQVKTRFPEMVPVIAARVAESIGRRQGNNDFAKVIDQINSDDSLRLDTGKRNAFIEKARADMFSAIPVGNEFYSSGVVQAMDKQIAQQELKWQGQTAQYHEQVQKEALSGEVVTALNSADPKAMLQFIDGNYSQSSSLNNMERNKVYVDTVIKHAAVSDDPSILERLPQKYLNVDSKAEIYKAGIALKGQQWAQFTRNKEFAAYQRDEADRTAQLGILKKLANNEPIDPSEYIQNPRTHAFAVSALSTPMVDPASSQAASQAFRTSLLGSSMVGSLGSQKDVTTKAMSLKGYLNPGDLAKLVEEIPKLMEGSVLLNDPAIRRAFQDNLGYRLDDLAKSSTGELSKMLGQGNLRGKAQTLFENELQSGYSAHYATTGEWPKNFDAKKIIDAAIGKATAQVDYRTSLQGLKEFTSSQSSQARATAPTTTATPSKSTAAPTGLPKGVTLIK